MNFDGISQMRSHNTNHRQQQHLVIKSLRAQSLGHLKTIHRPTHTQTYLYENLKVDLALFIHPSNLIKTFRECMRTYVLYTIKYERIKKCKRVQCE